jgi:hypothetical protein
MDVTDASPQRLQLATERFLAGEGLVYMDVVFRRDGERALQVSSFSGWAPELATPEMAQEGIARAKAVLSALVELIPEVRTVAACLPHEHFFCYDYGMGAVSIAREVGGAFEWVCKPGGGAP